jgi:hypothetical protein
VEDSQRLGEDAVERRCAAYTVYMRDSGDIGCRNGYCTFRDYTDAITQKPCFAGFVGCIILCCKQGNTHISAEFLCMFRFLVPPGHLVAQASYSGYPEGCCVVLLSILFGKSPSYMTYV